MKPKRRCFSAGGNSRYAIYFVESQTELENCRGMGTSTVPFDAGTRRWDCRRIGML